MDLRQTILDAPDLASETITVPEWNTSVIVSTMSGHARAAWATVAFNADGKIIDENMRARLLIHCIVDENKVLVFHPDDAPALENKNGDVIGRLFQIAKRLNGLGNDEVDNAEKK